MLKLSKKQLAQRDSLVSELEGALSALQKVIDDTVMRRLTQRFPLVLFTTLAVYIEVVAVDHILDGQYARAVFSSFVALTCAWAIPERR